MTAQVVAWAAFAVFVVALGVRVMLTEVAWPHYQVQVRPRRVVRGLDALTVASVLVLGVALAAVIGPALLDR